MRDIQNAVEEKEKKSGSKKKGLLKLFFYNYTQFFRLFLLYNIIKYIKDDRSEKK